jgi:hypothetical protein
MLRFRKEKSVMMMAYLVGPARGRGVWMRGGGGMMKAPQAKYFSNPRHSHYLEVLTVKKYLIDSKIKVVDLPLLCGKNSGQRGQ